jgi:hypothetical protein
MGAQFQRPVARAIVGKPNASAYPLTKAKDFDPTLEAARDSGYKSASRFAFGAVARKHRAMSRSCCMELPRVFGNRWKSTEIDAT